MNRIFTITPGRSGIHWLSAFFWCTTKWIPHTAHPELFSPTRSEDLEKRKELVRKIWKDLPEDYISTSLIPKNGYLEALGEMGARFIHLRRPIRDNAYSWLRMDGIPGRTPRGLGYHPLPGATDNLIDIADIREELTDYQLCLWLCIEVNARAEKISNQFDVYTIDLYDISISKKLCVRLLEWTKIPYDMDWWGLIGGNKIHEAVERDLRGRVSRATRIDEEIEFLEILRGRDEDCHNFL